MQAIESDRSAPSAPSETAPHRPAAKRLKGKREGAVGFVNDADPVTLYLNEIRGIKNMTLAEEQALAARIQQGDKEALHTLVQANLKFVVAVCRNYQYQGLPMGDLINEGNLGLMRAAQRFDASMNYKFISYGVWWIRQGILAALAEQSRSLRISAGKVTIIHRISKANQKLEQRLGRTPNIGELAEAMEMDEKEITECLQLASTPKSLDNPVKDANDDDVEFQLEDKSGARADEGAIRHLLQGKVGELLGTLEPREETILRLYYGIGLPTTLTLAEIAERFDLTRERVRQLKIRALERLRHPTRINKLAAFQD